MVEDTRDTAMWMLQGGGNLATLHLETSKEKAHLHASDSICFIAAVVIVIVGADVGGSVEYCKWGGDCPGPGPGMYAVDTLS